MGKLTKVAIGCACVGYALVAVGFVLLLRKNSNENFTETTIYVQGVESKTLNFESLSLKPGDTQNYLINLRSKSKALFGVEIIFNQVKDLGLTQFVDVSVECGEYKYEKSLSGLFDSKETLVRFDCGFEKDLLEQVNITYSIPSEIGNEAQGKTVDFNIKLNISQK